MTGLERDREKSELMKELHELGLRHGMTLVVVARPIDGGPNEQVGLLIDHKDETPVEDVYVRWLQAGVWLIQATNAVEDYIAEQRLLDAKKAEADSER
jgi:hypothetical protein